MKVRYTRRALADLQTIHSYLDARSPTAAGAIVAALRTSIDRLAHFPDLGPETDEPGVRELSLVRYPYKIYYSVTADEVRILPVRDARRQKWTSTP